MTRQEELRKLVAEATPGPWRADGEPWNRIVWTGQENRVCFMANFGGMNDDRDIATSELVAQAPTLATELAAALAEVEALRAEVARVARERDEALAFLDNAVSDAPEPITTLGSWLADMLDEDDWPTAERYLNAAVKSLADARIAAFRPAP